MSKTKFDVITEGPGIVTAQHPAIADLAPFPGTAPDATAGSDDDAPVPFDDVAARLEPADAEALNTLCAAKRSVSAQIAPLEKIGKTLSSDLKNLGARLNLPKRIIADGENGWDLRIGPGRETLDRGRLEIEMLQAGFYTKEGKPVGVQAVLDVIARATKEGEPSYSVYAAPKPKATAPR